MPRSIKTPKFQALITGLGLGIKGRSSTIRPLVIHRIVIMTDADCGWRPTSAPAPSLFYRYRKTLLEGGYSYIACPPPLPKWSAVKSHLLLQRQYLKTTLDGFGGKANLHNPAFQGPGRNDAQGSSGKHHGPTTRTMKRVEIEDAAEPIGILHQS